MKKALLTLAMTSSILLSCGGGGGGGGHYDPLVTTDNFIQKLNQLEPNFYLHQVVKRVATDADFFVFYDSSLDEYVSVDIARLRYEGWGASEAASAYAAGGLQNGFYEIVDANTPRAVVAYYAAGASEVFYEGLDTGYLYEDTKGTEKDMLFAARMLENTIAEQQGVAIAETYGLSDEQGIRLASGIQSWKALSSSREMTAADANAFSEEMFGFNFNDVDSAMEKLQAGDTAGADALIEQAAKSVDLTPENVRELVNDFL